MIDALLEVLKLGSPFLLVGFFEDIVRKLLELFDLFFYRVNLVVDLLGASSDLFEVWTEDGEELLNDGVGLGQIIQDLNHVDGSSKDVLLRLEVPLPDSRLLVLNVFLGGQELFSPSLKDLNALLDHLQGILWSLHLENLLDVDLYPDLVTNLV